MNDARTYGNLREAFGEEIREYTIFEHDLLPGKGTAVIDPDMGGYNNNSVETVSDFAVEASEFAYESLQGVSSYDVEGAGDLSADEAVAEIIGLTTEASAGNALTP